MNYEQSLLHDTLNIKTVFLYLITVSEIMSLYAQHKANEITDKSKTNTYITRTQN